MAESGEFRPMGAVVAELRQRIDRADTGTLFIVTDRNSSASISLHGGTIVHVAFRSKRGIEAIAMLSDVERCKASFQATPPRVQQSDELPSNEAILARLGVFAEPSNGAAAEPDTRVTQEQTRLLQEMLVEHLGPAAQFVVSEALQTTDAPARLLRLLAEEIPQGSERETFIARARARLGIAGG